MSAKAAKRTPALAGGPAILSVHLDMSLAVARKDFRAKLEGLQGRLNRLQRKAGKRGRKREYLQLIPANIYSRCTCGYLAAIDGLERDDETLASRLVVARCCEHLVLDATDHRRTPW